MYVKLMCSFELSFVVKAIMGHIRKAGMRWKLFSIFMLFSSKYFLLVLVKRKKEYEIGDVIGCDG